MTDSIISFANRTAAQWLIWMTKSSLDSLGVLIAVGAIWLVIRRRASPQVGYWLFLLVSLKLLVPFNVTVPEAIAQWTPSVAISTWLADSRDNQSVPSSPSRDAITRNMPVHSTPALETQTVPAVKIDATVATGVVTPGVVEFPLTRSALPTSDIQRPQLHLTAIAMLVWAASIALLFGRFVLNQRRFQRQLDASTDNTQSALDSDVLELCRVARVSQTVRVIETSAISTPAVWGLLQPTILIPIGFASSLSAHQLQWVLLHELAHVKRCDLWMAALQRLISILYFFNPALWFANRAIDQLREYACDDLAIALNDGSETDPSEAFIQILRRANFANIKAAGAIGIFGFDSRAACYARVKRMLDLDRPLRSRMSWLTCTLLIVLSLIVLPQIRANQKAKAKDKKQTPPPIVVEPINLPNVPSFDPTVPLAENEGKFEVTVVGPDGNPIEGADVAIGAGTRIKEASILAGTFVRHGGSKAHIKSGANGRVLIEYTPQNKWFYVEAVAPGFGPFHAGWNNANQLRQVPSKLNVALDPAYSIGGIILDPDGQPVVDALVEPFIETKKRPGDHSQMGAGARCNTDAAGKWRYDSVPNSLSQFQISVSHPHFKSLNHQFARGKFEIPPQGEPTAIIKLDRGITVTGRITDPAGNPISDATIRTVRDFQIREAKTNSAGQYTLRGYEPGTVRLIVMAPRMALELKSVDLTPNMAPVDVQMRVGEKIRVRVIDQQNNPVPKAFIYITKWRTVERPYGEFEGVNQEADDRGIWEWNEAPADEVVVSVSLDTTDGRIMLDDQILRPRREEYVLKLPGSPPVVIGKVVNARTKQPVKMFDVIAGYPDEKRNATNWQTWFRITATNGQYRYVHGFKPESYLMRIEARGYRTAISREIKSDDGSATIDFELEEAGGVESIVITPEGTPAVGAHVALSDVSSGIGIVDGDLMENGIFPRTDTDKKGRFEFPHQDSSFNLFVAHPAGYAQLTATMDSLPKPIKLQRWARLEGTFRIGNKPVADVKLNVFHVTNFKQFPNNSINHDAFTKKDGSFVMERLIPGNISLSRLNLLTPGQGYERAESVCQLPVNLVAGETTHVEFGNEGRPIVGTLQMSAPDEKFNWKEARVCLKPLLNTLPEPQPPEIPQGIRNDANKVKEWFETWKKTNEGQAWVGLQAAYATNLEHRRTKPTYTASADEVGSFRFEDVPAGFYEMNVDGKRFGFQLVEHGPFLTVPEMENNRSDEPLELGVLKLK